MKKCPKTINNNVCIKGTAVETLTAAEQKVNNTGENPKNTEENPELENLIEKTLMIILQNSLKSRSKAIGLAKLIEEKFCDTD